MKVKQKNILIAVTLLIIIIFIKIYFDNNSIQVSYYTVKSNKIPASMKGFKILQLSDLHSREFGNNNSKIIEKINSENPDIIVMTGDMINKKDTNYEVFFNLANHISKNFDTYYIFGNHEQNLNYEQRKILKDKLNEFGIKVLDNEKVTIKKGNDSINIYGLWFHLRYYKDLNMQTTKDLFFGEKQIKAILGDLDTNSYNILLTHNPLYADTYSNWGADLILCGHIHGGMIRIPFVGGLLSPERSFFPKYDSGKYQVNGKILIVNRGLGYGDFKIRLFNPPEISVITLSN
ncbi:MAG: metallophosphoesterase [Caloramator sp.]|jgi:hypothetical protein|uniref:metallophosphoesterase n=1 Tax=Caloramator sp. TaxID=1871330 RepID=UPI001D61824F|nr:metallophosphoesterase [Caloramator sp.]MBZ4663339.1 metallophosphoesterase [Caloramator sp.]